MTQVGGQDLCNVANSRQCSCPGLCIDDTSEAHQVQASNRSMIYPKD